jgi:nicotinamidase/pyrazinamidase
MRSSSSTSSTTSFPAARSPSLKGNGSSHRSTRSRRGFRASYATRDWHPADHSSFVHHGGPWPVHCVAGSRGASFHPALAMEHVDAVIDKGTHRETDGYSGFAATTLTEDLRAHGVRRVFVCGLATDYCVKATALDARAAGFETIVVEDASAAVNMRASVAIARSDEIA